MVNLPHFREYSFVPMLVQFALAFPEKATSPDTVLFLAKPENPPQQGRCPSALEAYIMVVMLDAYLSRRDGQQTPASTLRYYQNAFFTEIAERLANGKVEVKDAVRVNTLFAEAFGLLHQLLGQDAQNLTSESLFAVLPGLSEKDKQAWRANVIALHSLFLLYACNLSSDTLLPYQTERQMLRLWWEWDAMNRRVSNNYVDPCTGLDPVTSEIFGTMPLRPGRDSNRFMAINLAIFTRLAGILRERTMTVNDTEIRDVTQQDALNSHASDSEMDALRGYLTSLDPATTFLGSFLKDAA